MTDWVHAWQEFMLEAEREADQQPDYRVHVHPVVVDACRPVFGDAWCDRYLLAHPVGVKPVWETAVQQAIWHKAWELEHLYGGMTGEPRGALAAQQRDTPGPSRGGTGTLLPEWATQRRPA